MALPPLNWHVPCCWKLTCKHVPDVVLLILITRVYQICVGPLCLYLSDNTFHSKPNKHLKALWGKVRGSFKFLRFIIWWAWMSMHNIKYQKINDGPPSSAERKDGMIKVYRLGPLGTINIIIKFKWLTEFFWIFHYMPG